LLRISAAFLLVSAPFLFSIDADGYKAMQDVWGVKRHYFAHDIRISNTIGHLISPILRWFGYWGLFAV